MSKKPIMIVMALLVLISLVYAGQGILMHYKVAKEEFKFHQTQERYFLQSKDVRDGASANSELNRDLVEIKNYPSELLRLKLVGVGKILTGIFILLFAILVALVMMPVRLAQTLKENQQT